MRRGRASRGQCINDQSRHNGNPSRLILSAAGGGGLRCGRLDRWHGASGDVHVEQHRHQLERRSQLEYRQFPRRHSQRPGPVQHHGGHEPQHQQLGEPRPHLVSNGRQWGLHHFRQPRADPDADGHHHPGQRDHELDGFTDTISAPITFAPSDANTQVISNGGTLTLSGPITATAVNGLKFIGAGTLMLSSAANNFSGGLNLNAGKLNVATGALGSSGNITFTGGTLQYNGNGTDFASRIVNSTSAISIDSNGNAVTFANALANTNIGGLTVIGTGGGSLTLAAANNYSGTTTLTSGQLNINNAGALGSGSFTLSANGGTIDNTSGGAISVAQGGPSSLFNFTFGGSNNLTFSGTTAIAVNAGRTITLGGTNSTLTFGGALQNTATGSTAPAVTVNGAGNTLVVGGASLSSATSPGITISGTANTNVLVNGTIANGVQSSGNIAIQNVTATFSGTNTYTGTTTVQTFSTLKLGSAHALGNTSSVSVTSSSKLDLNGWTLDTAVPITGTAGMGGTLTNSSAAAASYSGNMNATGATIVDGVGDITLSGTIAGSGGGTGAITKNGSNKLTVTAANTYSAGNIVVNAGTLALSGAGSFNSSPTLIVGTGAGSTAKLDVTGVTGGVYNLPSGQTLKGTGTVQGNISIGSGSTIAPGNSPAR
jgi:autotransporter-associated beta strand protein